VYFYGHDGGGGPQLEVYLQNVRMVISGEDSAVVADITSRGLEGGGLVEYPDVEFVTLDTAGLDLEANGKGVVKVNDLATAVTPTEPGRSPGSTSSVRRSTRCRSRSSSGADLATRAGYDGGRLSDHRVQLVEPPRGVHSKRVS
jgi:hypothetical protein